MQATCSFLKPSSALDLLEAAQASINELKTQVYSGTDSLSQVVECTFGLLTQCISNNPTAVSLENAKVISVLAYQANLQFQNNADIANKVKDITAIFSKISETLSISLSGGQVPDLSETLEPSQEELASVAPSGDRRNSRIE